MSEKHRSSAGLRWGGLLIGLLAAPLVGCGGSVLEDPEAGAGSSNVGPGGAFDQAGAFGSAGSPSSAGDVALGGTEAGGAIGQAGTIGKAGTSSSNGGSGTSSSEAGSSDTSSPEAGSPGAGSPGAGSPGAGSAGSAGTGGSSSPLPGLTIEQCRNANALVIVSNGGDYTYAGNCASGAVLGYIDDGTLPGELCCTRPSHGNSCGGYGDDPCTGADVYCAYAAGERCGETDLGALCTPRPTECPDLYAPVCGCDEKTYDNSCVANAAGTGIYAASACPIGE